MEFNLNRAVYLAAKTKLKLPNKLMSYIPMSEILNGVASYGITGYAHKAQIPEEQLNEMYNSGNMGISPTIDEYKEQIKAKVAYSLSEAFYKQNIDSNSYYSMIATLNDFSNAGESFGDTGEFNLATDSLDDFKNEDLTLETIPFPAISGLVGEIMTQSLICIAGRPKTGKSRHLLSFGLSLIESGQCNEMWFYENEYTHSQIVHIAAPMGKEFSLGNSPVLIRRPASINYQQILEECEENPNPKRVILFDSPDWSVGTVTDNRRLAFYPILSKMLKMRQHNRYVVYSSQTNRQATGKPKPEHLSESDLKLQLSDYVFGIWKAEEESLGSDRVVHSTVMAQRFGNLLTTNNIYPYRFNYVTGRMETISGGLDNEEY